jgi:hypothetical protein
LIPSSHLRVGLSSGLFPSGFLTRTLCNFLSYPMRATCPTHLIRFDFICLMISGDEYKLWSTLCNFLHSPVTSSLMTPNILLRTLFSNTLSQCSSLNARDQVSHPYRATGRIMVLYILTFTFLDSTRDDKRLWTEWEWPNGYELNSYKSCITCSKFPYKSVYTVRNFIQIRVGARS